MQVADLANNNLMMGGAGLPVWVIHLQRHFARRRKHGHLTAALRFLHFAAPTPKNSSKKILFRHRQYVQLICVGRPPITGAFCTKENIERRLLLFHLKSIRNRQKECSRQCKSFSGVFSWSRRQCHLGGILHLQGTRTLVFLWNFSSIRQTGEQI